MSDPMISAAALAARLDDPELVIVDCRFSLADPERGRRDYQTNHLPGARYAHLDHDLSAPVVPGRSGRHPLPDPQRFSTWLGSQGIGNDSFVVAYDDDVGAIAARLWWMLRWLGHDNAAVLDGGYAAWREAQLPLSSEAPEVEPLNFTPRLRPNLIASAAEVDALRNDPRYRLLDARAEARFRGEHEPIDPVAGHISGARNLPHAALCRDGRMLPAAGIVERFAEVSAEGQPELVAYCGSGVTACYLVLGAERAGLAPVRLYPGSYSEWITDPRRSVSKA